MPDGGVVLRLQAEHEIRGSGNYAYVRLRGATESQPWILRTTQVFRLDENGHWCRLHRHADPLIRYRPGDETFALAREPRA